MARVFTPKVVTANDLVEGDVVYLTAAGGWSRRHADAAVAADEAQAAALLGTAEAQQDRVVGPYLADTARGEEGEPLPVHYREAIRTRGPSNYFHGKQAGA